MCACVTDMDKISEDVIGIISGFLTMKEIDCLMCVNTMFFNIIFRDKIILKKRLKYIHNCIRSLEFMKKRLDGHPDYYLDDMIYKYYFLQYQLKQSSKNILLFHIPFEI